VSVWTLSAHLLQDAAIAVAREKGYRSATEDYVPGSVVRGALATAWIRENGLPASATADVRKQFVDLFESDVSFGPLFLNSTPFLPLSAQVCKYQPDPDCRFIVFDAAAPENSTNPTSPPSLCPTCNGNLVAAKGQATTSTKTARTRTKLTADERAEESNLFRRDAIQRGTTVHGRMFDPNNQLYDWLVGSPSRTNVIFGSGGSVMGRVKLSVAPPTPQPGPGRNGTFMVIRLESPGIFIDALTIPTIDLPLDEIANIVGAEQTGLKVQRAWVRPTTVSGWHAASGLPKSAEWACAIGSTWRLSSPPLNDAQLNRLENTALGWRKSEGFGRIAVNPGPWPAAPPPAENKGPSEALQPPTRPFAPLRELDAREQRYLIGIVQERLVKLEGAQTMRPLQPNTREREYTTSQQAEVAALRESNDPKELRAALRMLRSLEQAPS
jgi:CRISPR-associated protein Csx10